MTRTASIEIIIRTAAGTGSFIGVNSSGEDNGDSSENIKFVRVGEDADDIEHRGFGFDEVAAQTSISF